MSLIPKDEAELIRLKMQMEIIRTVCPMMMIFIQLFIIIHIYWGAYYDLRNGIIRNPQSETSKKNCENVEEKKKDKSRAGLVLGKNHANYKCGWEPFAFGMFHVEHSALKISWKNAWLSEIFGAGAPVVSQRLYSGGLHLDSREFTPKGVVFYEKSARARQ